MISRGGLPSTRYVTHSLEYMVPASCQRQASCILSVTPQTKCLFATDVLEFHHRLFQFDCRIDVFVVGCTNSNRKYILCLTFNSFSVVIPLAVRLQVDNLILVHHQLSKTTCVFDLKWGTVGRDGNYLDGHPVETLQPMMKPRSMLAPPPLPDGSPQPCNLYVTSTVCLNVA